MGSLDAYFYTAKVALALTSIAAVVFSYYYFTSSPSESSATTASYMNSSCVASEKVLEAVNRTVVDPLTSSFVREGSISSASENVSVSIVKRML